MTALRWAFRASVRAVGVLKRAVTGVDYPGLSWRRLRAFARGAGCLTDCAEGHTYEPGCAWGPNWHGLLADILFPLPRRASELDVATRAAIHDALTQAVEISFAEPERHRPLDHPGPDDEPWHCQVCQGPCREAIDAAVDTGPAEVGVSWLAGLEGLTGPQRVRAALRREGLAATGGDSPQWALPTPWPPVLGTEVCQALGHDWGEWECMVLTSDFPVRRWCARCEEQQTWTGPAEPEPEPRQR